MSGIKRYDVEPLNPVGQSVDESSDGLWVYFDDHAAEIARLRAEADALRHGLEAVYQFGSDTLRGPTGDTPDDRKWHRTAVLEMTNRASRTITTGSWKKDGDAAMGADA